MRQLSETQALLNNMKEHVHKLHEVVSGAGNHRGSNMSLCPEIACIADLSQQIAGS